jgi:hypothetical protein
MVPRIVRQVDALAKIGPDEHFRFFMHPSLEKSASLEFNTKGLSSLSIAPTIRDFSSDPNCVGNAEAGVARVTWSVDGGKKTRLMVDRNYSGVVNVDITNSSRLELEVDKGNAVIWCDWVTVGFVNVR